MSVNPYQFSNWPNAPKYYVFWEDFGKEYPLTSNLPVTATSPYSATALNTGTFAQTTDEGLAVAVLSGAATTDNSGVQLQGDMETFSLIAGKRVRALTRWKCSDGTEDEVYFGIGITDTTFIDGAGTLAAGLTHTDSVGVYKPDGEANLYGVVRRDSVNVIVTGAVPITATSYNTIGFEVLMDPTTAGLGYFNFFVNGTQYTGGSSTVMPYSAEEILTPTFAFLTGNATGTKTCTVDFMGVMQER